MEQRGQASAVLVVGGAPKVEECLRRKTKQKTVTLVLAHFEGLGGGGREVWVAHTGQGYLGFCYDALV